MWNGNAATDARRSEIVALLDLVRHCLRRQVEVRRSACGQRLQQAGLVAARDIDGHAVRREYLPDVDRLLHAIASITLEHAGDSRCRFPSAGAAGARGLSRSCV